MTREMNWKDLLCNERLCDRSDPDEIESTRSAFDGDIQRIIFSGAFRRLSKKTQVHPLVANDHIHTRLTHSLEVSQVGKSLGKVLAARIQLPDQIKPEDLGSIVEAACLAHDLGNPPFGHAGEEAVRHWFEANGNRIFHALSKKYKNDLISFEGNAQGFRMLTQTENHLFKGGMRLTYATLGTFMKYPWTSEKSSEKFGAFLSEEQILNDVAEKTGLIRKGPHEWCRHPLAYLVEAADDICYGILDLEDAVELKILTFKQVYQLVAPIFDKKEMETIESSFGNDAEYRVNLSRLRGPLFAKAISAAIDGFEKSQKNIMTGCFAGDLFTSLDDEDPRKKMISSMKSLARKSIYPDSKKVEIELGSYATFEALLATFCHAFLENSKHINSNKDEHPLGWKSSLVIKMLGSHAPNKENAPIGGWSDYQSLRRAIDYIAGMTDNYAIYVATQINGGGSGNSFRH